MRERTGIFVLGVLLAAAAAVAALVLFGGPPPRDAVQAIALLSGLALIAELLAYLLPRGARGSIAFIPYLAAVLIVPHWITVAAAVLIKALVEAHRHVDFQKAFFNIAQYALNI